jgi:hypothetical protein
MKTDRFTVETVLENMPTVRFSSLTENHIIFLVVDF